MYDSVPELTDALISELSVRASSSGWSARENPQLLRENDRGAIESLLLDQSTTSVVGRPDERLPAFRRALDLQPASLSLLLCGLDADKPADAYRAALWWTGLVRSELAPTKRSDLHLFLVAPRGTSSQAAWQGHRSRYESDERFCRKFVWLPSQDPSRDEIDAFLDRTFLAKPWQSPSVAPQSLDPVERLLQEAYRGGLLHPDEVSQWITRLGQPDTTGGQQVADELVRILEARQ